MIECNRCGICCTQLKSNPLYTHLDRGDGLCINLDIETKECQIFDSRPDICNSKMMYQHHFRKMAPVKFTELNRELCAEMQKGPYGHSVKPS